MVCAPGERGWPLIAYGDVAGVSLWDVNLSAERPMGFMILERKTWKIWILLSVDRVARFGRAFSGSCE
jgi:hypothetical protein